MKGIEFIKDEKGTPIKAVIDLNEYRALFERFFETALQAKSTSTNTADTQTLSKVPHIIQNAILAARALIGTKHLSIDPKGIDCSGLTSSAYKTAGINIPRSSRDQAKIGQAIEKNQLQPGDLVFFATGTDPNYISHVGLITKSSTKPEEITFIHTSTKRGVVEEALFQWEYWQKAYRSACRPPIV